MNGNSFLLDTNVIIGLLKQAPAAMALLDQQTVGTNQSGYSAITRMELLSYPQLQPIEKETIEQLLNLLTYYPITRAEEDIAISLRSEQRLKLPDAIILATAKHHQLTLLTLDQKLQDADKNS